MTLKTLVFITGVLSLAACHNHGGHGHGDVSPTSPFPAVTSFEQCEAAGGRIQENHPRTCVLGEQSFVEEIGGAPQTNGPATDSGSVVEIYEIGPEMVPCSGVGPGQCMIVNGQVFYGGIEGFTHTPGVTSVIEVERTQRCDPKIINSCPQDVGIYRYRMIRVISQN